MENSVVIAILTQVVVYCLAFWDFDFIFGIILISGFERSVSQDLERLRRLWVVDDVRHRRSRCGAGPDAAQFDLIRLIM